MQNESKGVYVQMPKPEPSNESERLLAALVSKMEQTVILKEHYSEFCAAQEYLLNKFHSSLKVEEFTPSEATV